MARTARVRPQPARVTEPIHLGAIGKFFPMEVWIGFSRRRIARVAAIGSFRRAWFRGWRLVSLDGSMLDLDDSEANASAFSRPAAFRGHSAFPQRRFVTLVENGTHVLFGTKRDSRRRDPHGVAAPRERWSGHRWHRPAQGHLRTRRAPGTVEAGRAGRNRLGPDQRYEVP